MKLYPHETERVTIYQYPGRVIMPDDLFDRNIADHEFDGYSVNSYQIGPAIFLEVEEPEPALRSIWEIFCCEYCAGQHMEKLVKANEGNITSDVRKKWDGRVK